VAVVDEGGRDGAVDALVVEEGDRDVVRVEVRAGHVGARVVRRPAGPELRRARRVEHVGVPQDERAAPTVPGSALLAQAVHRVADGAAPAHRPGVVERGVGPPASLLVLRGLDDGRAVGTVDVEPERVEPQGDDEPGGADADDAVLALDGQVDRQRQRVDVDGEGRGLVEDPAAADLQAHDVVADDVDAQRFAVQVREHAVPGLLDVADPLEADEAVVSEHARSLLGARSRHAARHVR
jgi:hypothetical protein